MEKIRRHPLYIFGADLPLRAFYAAGILMRRAPQWILATLYHRIATQHAVACDCILLVGFTDEWH